MELFIGRIRLFLKGLNVFKRVKELECRVYRLRKATYFRIDTGHPELDVIFNYNKIGTREILVQLVEQLGFEIIPEFDYGQVIVDRLVIQRKPKKK